MHRSMAKGAAVVTTYSLVTSAVKTAQVQRERQSCRDKDAFPSTNMYFQIRDPKVKYAVEEINFDTCDTVS